jgi:hypothetical protein
VRHLLAGVRRSWAAPDRNGNGVPERHRESCGQLGGHRTVWAGGDVPPGAVLTRKLTRIAQPQKRFCPLMYQDSPTDVPSSAHLCAYLDLPVYIRGSAHLRWSVDSNIARAYIAVTSGTMNPFLTCSADLRNNLSARELHSPGTRSCPS